MLIQVAIFASSSLSKVGTIFIKLMKEFQILSKQVIYRVSNLAAKGIGQRKRNNSERLKKLMTQSFWLETEP